MKKIKKYLSKEIAWQLDMFVLLSSFIDIYVDYKKEEKKLMLNYSSTIALTFNYGEKSVSH